MVVLAANLTGSYRYDDEEDDDDGLEQGDKCHPHRQVLALVLVPDQDLIRCRKEKPHLVGQEGIDEGPCEQDDRVHDRQGDDQ